MKQTETRVLGRVLQLIGFICWIHSLQENLYTWSMWIVIIASAVLIVEGAYIEFSNEEGKC